MGNPTLDYLQTLIPGILPIFNTPQPAPTAPNSGQNYRGSGLTEKQYYANVPKGTPRPEGYFDALATVVYGTTQNDPKSFAEFIGSQRGRGYRAGNAPGAQVGKALSGAAQGAAQGATQGAFNGIAALAIVAVLLYASKKKGLW